MKNIIIKIVPAAIFSLLLITLFGCQKDNVQKIKQRNWQLVWSDDFNGTAGMSPDSAKWQFDIGTGPNHDGWGNAELEYYTNRTSNASLDGNGNLVITARAESYAGSGFTSARIKTLKKLEQTYGRFEARIKTPWGPGIWPAFWLLGANVDSLGWPQCGEIDIMELRGQKPNIINGTVHGPGYSGAGGITKSFAFGNERFDVNFHVFAVEWGENFIDFFVDSTLYQEITPGNVTGNWVFNHPFFIILNVAVGGNYVGFPTSQTPFPQTMLVDYVRVYKEAD
ncbi:MAG: glycoside hydrolase family 16 protein [Bacteroidetes bacterium]|nr:glycoside hydrolase family 16 protein [Bacteroidota bacterium]